MSEVERKKKKDKKKDKKKIKKSGVRTKFLLESLRQDYYNLQDENQKLRDIILERLPSAADAIFTDCCPPRKKVNSIDELAQMSNMTIQEEDEEEEEE